jgi:hypothetical protein
MVKSASRRRLFAITVLAIVCTTLVAAVSQESPPGVGENAKLSQEFQTRAMKYLELRKQVAGKSPKSSDSPEAIAANQRELASRIQKARAGAKQGEIFTPELTAFFRRQIGATLNGPHGNEIRSSLRHADPVNVKFQVNEAYPQKLPLQSTPPSLLLNLPAAPDGLEYRIVGSDLVLRDTEANIIVDFIPNVIS